MLGVLGFFILASVLHVSDAALQEGPTFKKFIGNAIELNGKAIQSLPKSVFPMEYLLKEANANLEKILDATLTEGPSFKKFIENSIRLNEKAMESLPDGVFPMEHLLQEANADLKQVLEKTDPQGKFALLRSALEKETRGLSMIGVFCENPKADCKKARAKAAESTETMATAVSEICEPKKDVINDIFANTIIRSGSDLEFEIWTAGMQVLMEIENGC
ncbi:unnamed protein product [Nippostrongylus brasiliensis]|uniref:DUF148 domain-containing protein n=1 Tax=Nippostrongylus brasiliensis TaxID=27835 RepID=A0A0N4Y8R5_NIPBR|nr:unnamed protein product [Nippostrongylus brasiliensis]